MKIIEIMFYEPGNPGNKCYLPVGNRDTDELKKIAEIQRNLFDRTEHKFIMTETD